MTNTSENPATVSHSIGWLMHYALRRWRPMVVVIAAMLLRIALDLLKPWPMKVLVDHVLDQNDVSPTIARGLACLPGDHSRLSLDAWCVGATTVIFIAGWCITAVSGMANVNLGQRLAY